MNEKEQEKFRKHMHEFTRDQLVGWMSAISFILIMKETNKKLCSKLLFMFDICGEVINEKE